MKQTEPVYRRKCGWRCVIGGLIALAFMAIAVVAAIGGTLDFNRNGMVDDVWAALVIVIMCGGIGLTLMYLTISRRDYVDEDGETIPYIIMAELLSGLGPEPDFDTDNGNDEI